MIKSRPKNKNDLFSSKIICDNCGFYYRAKTCHSNSKYKRTIWRCNNKYNKKEPCKTPHLYKEEIEEAFVDSINKLIANKKNIIEDLKLLEYIFDTKELKEKLNSSIEIMNLNKEKIEQIIEENSNASQDQLE